jgi:hypothetical protein
MHLANIRRSRVSLVVLASIVFATFLGGAAAAEPPKKAAPTPLIKVGQPVDWWFVYKFNSRFPGCTGDMPRECPFGGNVQNYRSFGQQYVYASSANQQLQEGTGCSGGTTSDPVGATFDQVYNGPYSYIFWNDQFYGDPLATSGTPWGHSKGMLAWNDAGEGLILQVTTPSWPASGSASFRRESGNTLGCIVKPNNVRAAQHFLAVKLTRDDLQKVLRALENSSIRTNLGKEKIARNGGPQEIRELVAKLGKISDSTLIMKERLSTGIVLISKPSKLHVPPWQMVSSVLDGVSLRTATWWNHAKIYSTTTSTRVTCWDDNLGPRGAVEIATSGKWRDKQLNLKGGANHAKFGVSTSPDTHYAIFGDLNQEGALTGNARACMKSQNGRGGLFFVLNNEALHRQISALVAGATAPQGAQR